VAPQPVPQPAKSKDEGAVVPPKPEAAPKPAVRPPVQEDLPDLEPGRMRSLFDPIDD
jgi:hypothetical protein